jgi:hypothetical protein
MRVTRTETHNDALAEMVHEVRGKLLGIEIVKELKKLDLPDVDLTEAKAMARTALEAIAQGKIGYAIVCGVKC